MEKASLVYSMDKQKHSRTEEEREPIGGSREVERLAFSPTKLMQLKNSLLLLSILSIDTVLLSSAGIRLLYILEAVQDINYGVVAPTIAVFWSLVPTQVGEYFNLEVDRNLKWK